MSNYREVETMSTQEIKDACEQAHCFRQANVLLKNHLLNINKLVGRVFQEKIDVSHFNKGNVNCPKCRKPYEIMTILDFDDVGRKLGNCSDCKYNEWVEDGGDIIDAYHYFTKGYKTQQMVVIGHTNI